MAVKLSDAVRNAMLDAYETTIGTAPKLQLRSGAPPTNITDADSGTLLAEITCPSDWMGAASNGSKAQAGSWTTTGLAATGAVTVSGAGAVTLDPFSAVQIGAILTTGQAAQIISAITDSKTGAVAISGSHDAVMAAITQLATGRVYDASAVIQTTDKGLVAIVERRGVLALPAEDRGIKWTH